MRNEALIEKFMEKLHLEAAEDAVVKKILEQFHRGLQDIKNYELMRDARNSEHDQKNKYYECYLSWRAAHGVMEHKLRLMTKQRDKYKNAVKMMKNKIADTRLNALGGQ